MSQLSDWKGAHMCTENHVCFGRIHGSQLREGANARMPGTYHGTRVPPLTGTYVLIMLLSDCMIQLASELAS